MKAIGAWKSFYGICGDYVKAIAAGKSFNGLCGDYVKSIAAGKSFFGGLCRDYVEAIWTWSIVGMLLKNFLDCCVHYQQLHYRQ